MKKLRLSFVLGLALALLPTLASAQQTGTVSGRVVDQSTQQPLAGVQIFVEGTQRGSLTNQDGRFLIPNVPAGPQQVRASLIGYNRGLETVDVPAGGTATADFALSQSAVELGAVIVTATGERQSLREVGNAVGTVNVAEDVEAATINDVSQVLQGRTAGVSVLAAGGTTGTGTRVRIRGSNSMSLANEPLLIIDGVRANNNPDFVNRIAVGGQDPNRLNDLNVEDIETIEVLKGPAASALYGTAAANGVIVITTKKGRSGETRYRAYTEQVSVEEVADYPANFTAFLADPNTVEDAEGCLIAIDGPCPVVQSFNPLEDSRSTPFETGYRQRYGFSASGGSELATFYLSADYEQEDGIYKFDFNTLDKLNLRANITGQLQDNLDIQVNTGYINSDLRLPQNDNNILGILSGALLGVSTEFDEETCGFLVQCPEGLAAINTRQTVERITGSTTVNYLPIPWLSVVGTAGFDRVNQFDNETIPPERVFFSSLPEGERTSERAQISNYTTNLSATASYEFTPSITATTSVGGQYTEEIFRSTEAFGARLLAGVESLEGTTARFSVDEDNSQIRTIGAFVQQQLTFNDRIYLTGAVRADDNSAFGRDFGLAYYPSASMSWVVAEEPWFPQADFLSTLRLRAAYGRSGLRPGQLDAIQFLNPVAVTAVSGSVPGFEIGGTGNVVLEPETSTEVEVGFDAGVLSDRVGVELTYFNKRSESALISRRLPPSLGLSESRFENLGEVRNSGVEALFKTRLIEMPQARWEASVSASWIDNELEDIGTDPVTGEPIPEIIFGLGLNSQRHAEGLPLGGYYGTPFTFDDANGDGIIQVSEVTPGDSATFLGDAFPTREMQFQSDLTLFDVVRISGLLDYRAGYKQFNSTEEFRCGAFFNCEALYNADVDIERQAAAVAAAFYGTHAGYIEDADFVKLRELAIRFTVPESISRRFRTDNVAITLAGRNLATWTDYRGLDPEINFSGNNSNFTTAEFLSQPPVRFYTLRVDVGF